MAHLHHLRTVDDWAEVQVVGRGANHTYTEMLVVGSTGTEQEGNMKYQGNRLARKAYVRHLRDT